MDRNRVDSTTSLGSLGDDDDPYFPELHSVPRHSPDEDDELNYDDDQQRPYATSNTSSSSSVRPSSLDFSTATTNNGNNNGTKPITSRLPFPSLSQIAYGNTNANNSTNNINNGLRKGTISTSISPLSTAKLKGNPSSSSSLMNSSSGNTVPSSSSVYRKLAKPPTNPNVSNKNYAYLPTSHLSQRRQPRSTKTADASLINTGNNYLQDDDYDDQHSTNNNRHRNTNSSGNTSEASFVGGAHLSTLKYVNNTVSSSLSTGSNPVKDSSSPLYKSAPVLTKTTLDDIPLSSSTTTTLPDNIFDLFDYTVPLSSLSTSSSSVLNTSNVSITNPAEITKTTLDDFLSSSTMFPSSLENTIKNNSDNASTLPITIEHNPSSVGVTTLDDFLSPRPLITTASLPSHSSSILNNNSIPPTLPLVPLPVTNIPTPPITQYSSTPITTISLSVFSQGNSIATLRPPPSATTVTGTHRRITPTSSTAVPHPSQENVYGGALQTPYDTTNVSGSNNGTGTRIGKTKIAQTVTSLQMKQQQLYHQQSSLPPTELATLSANVHGKSLPVGTGNGTESTKPSPSSSSVTIMKRLSASKDHTVNIGSSIDPQTIINTKDNHGIIASTTESSDQYSDSSPSATTERRLSSHSHNRSLTTIRLSKDDSSTNNRRTSGISTNGSGIFDSSNQSIEETDESETYENNNNNASVVPPRKTSATSNYRTSSSVPGTEYDPPSSSSSSIVKMNNNNSNNDLVVFSPGNSSSSAPTTVNTLTKSKVGAPTIPSTRSRTPNQYHHSYTAAANAMNTDGRGCRGFLKKQIYSFKEAFDLLPLPRYLGTVPVETHRLDWKEFSYLLLCQRLEHYSTAYVRLAQARNAIIMEREQSLENQRVLRLQMLQQQQQQQRLSSSLRTVPLRETHRERRPSLTSTSSDSASVTPSLESSSNVQSPNRPDNTSVTTGTDIHTDNTTNNRPVSIGTKLSITETTETSNSGDSTKDTNTDHHNTPIVPLPELPIRPPMESVWTMKFSPDGRYLAVAGGTDQGAVIRIWQVTVWNQKANTNGNVTPSVPEHTTSNGPSHAPTTTELSTTVSTVQRERTGSTPSTVSKTSEYSGSAAKHDTVPTNSYSQKDIDNIVRKISQSSTQTPSTNIPDKGNSNNNSSSTVNNNINHSSSKSSASSVSEPSIGSPSGIDHSSPTVPTPTTMDEKRRTVSLPRTHLSSSSTTDTNGLFYPPVSVNSSSSSTTPPTAAVGTVPYLLANELLTTQQPFFHPVPYREWLGHDAHIVDLSWSNTNLLLSASMDGFVRLWHVSRTECLHKFQHPDCVTSVAFLPTDESLFMTGCFDRKLRLWSLETGRVTIWQATNTMITAAAFSPDGKYAIAGLFNGTAILYLTDGLRFRATLDCRNRRGPFRHGKKVTGIEFTTNSSHALITTNDSRIRMIDLLSFRTVTKYVGLRNMNMQVKATFDATMDRIISGSEDGYVYVWRTRNDHYIPTINPRLSGYDWTRVRSYEKFMGKEGYQSLDVETGLAIEIISELGIKRTPAITVAIFAPPAALQLARPIEAVHEWGGSLVPVDVLLSLRDGDGGRNAAASRVVDPSPLSPLWTTIKDNHNVIITADSRGVLRVYEQGMDKERM